MAWNKYCLLWTECLCHPKFTCWNLTPSAMDLGDGYYHGILRAYPCGSMCQNCLPWACGGWLGHEGGALLSGIRALVNETLESSFAPSAIEDTVRRQLPAQLGSGLLPDTKPAHAYILSLRPCLAGQTPSQAGSSWGMDRAASASSDQCALLTPSFLEGILEHIFPNCDLILGPQEWPR